MLLTEKLTEKLSVFNLICMSRKLIIDSLIY